MGRTIFCEHYTGTYGHKECRAGVEYDSIILGKGTKKMSMPCVIGSRQNYNPLGATCDKCKMPTAEELAAQEAADAKHFQDTMTARKAIVDHLGGPWRKGMAGSAGVIDCPVCGCKSSLRFSRAGVNGHVHAGCTTANCVQWME